MQFHLCHTCFTALGHNQTVTSFTMDGKDVICETCYSNDVHCLKCNKTNMCTNNNRDRYFRKCTFVEYINYICPRCIEFCTNPTDYYGKMLFGIKPLDILVHGPCIGCNDANGYQMIIPHDEIPKAQEFLSNQPYYICSGCLLLDKTGMIPRQLPTQTGNSMNSGSSLQVTIRVCSCCNERFQLSNNNNNNDSNAKNSPYGEVSLDTIASFKLLYKQIRDQCKDYVTCCGSCINKMGDTRPLLKYNNIYMYVPQAANCGPRDPCTICKYRCLSNVILHISTTDKDLLIQQASNLSTCDDSI